MPKAFNPDKYREDAEKALVTATEAKTKADAALVKAKEAQAKATAAKQAAVDKAQEKVDVAAATIARSKAYLERTANLDGAVTAGQADDDAPAEDDVA